MHYAQSLIPLKPKNGLEWGTRDKVIERYNKFESVLRCALLWASTDTDLGQFFLSGMTITNKFGALPCKRH